ncbi:MAG TPA: low molecular weight protein-tyrosine-phosphatase [Burkholderiaceae bacterium]
MSPESAPAPDHAAAGGRIRVLMVCLGNICRSPTAEAMLRRHVREAGLEALVEVDSAGTADYHVGSPPDRRAIAHGEGRGLAMRHLRGRQVERADFDRFDFVFAMDEDNLANLARLRPAGSRARLGLLLDLAPHAGAREVPDPYYGGAEGFERVLDLVDAACAAFVATLGRG